MWSASSKIGIGGWLAIPIKRKEETHLKTNENDGDSSKIQRILSLEMAWNMWVVKMFNVRKQADSLVTQSRTCSGKMNFVAKWKVTKHNPQTNTPSVKESVIVLWIDAVS